MRPYHKLVSLLLTLACSAVAEAGIEGRIVGYGTYTVTNNYKQFRTPGSIKGISRAYMDPKRQAGSRAGQQASTLAGARRNDLNGR
jgi:hypothetical protein